MINRGIKLIGKVDNLDDKFESMLNKQFDYGTPYAEENLEILRERRANNKLVTALSFGSPRESKELED